jgi:hypothetical protein
MKIDSALCGMAQSRFYVQAIQKILCAMPHSAEFFTKIFDHNSALCCTVRIQLSAMQHSAELRLPAMRHSAEFRLSAMRHSVEFRHICYVKPKRVC